MKNSPRCDYEGCECNGKTYLNGFRFACDNCCTVEAHVDDYPVHANGPEMFAVLAQIVDAVDGNLAHISAQGAQRAARAIQQARAIVDRIRADEVRASKGIR